MTKIEEVRSAMIAAMKPGTRRGRPLFLFCFPHSKTKPSTKEPV